MRRLYFVVNPISGSGRGRERFEEVRSLLDQMSADYGFAFTEYAGHAVPLTREALERGERTVVAVGGDGTLREVASVIAGRGDAFLGLVPSGTGNDFAEGLGLPEDTSALIEILLSGAPVSIDAGDANGEFFINVAGFGFDVDVVRYTEKYKKKLNGMLPYMLGIFKSLVYLSRTPVTAVTDAGERIETVCTLFSACNGSRFAGGIKLAPKASPADGLLDVCILKAVSRPRFLYLLPKYMKGKHLGFDDFVYFKAKSVECVCAAGGHTQLDGELIGSTPVTFSVRPGAISMLASK